MNRLFRKKATTRVALLCLGLTGVLLGLFLAKYKVPFSNIYFFLVVPLLFIVQKKQKIALPAVLLVGIIIGLWRGAGFFNEVGKYNKYYGNKITISGVVLDDMSYDDRRQSEFHVGKVEVDGEKLPGRVRIRAQTGGNVKRGDKIAASGKFNRTLGTSRQGGISFAAVKTLQKNSSWIEEIRGKFFASIYSVLPEPHASLGLGYLVGVRTALPDTFTDQLSLVGLTHIVAVSGYNLTILVQAVRRLFAKKSAYQSVLFSALLIVGFLLMTGWSPSIMRAAIVTGFSLIAWYYGRTFKPLLLILLGAVITAYISPLYVWGDAGWYLSFLAFTGVLIFAPLVMHKIYKAKKPKFLTAILIETLAAQLLTMPYIALLFGKVSLIAPIANLFVVPLIPFIMLLVFIVGVIGVVAPILALWIAIVPRALLSLNIWTVEKLSTVTYAQVNIRVSAALVLLAYAILLTIVLFLWRSYRHANQVKQVEQIDWNLV
jgi:competence protein ComEC